MIPGPGKRKKNQEEEEPPKGIPSRSLRRTKPNQGSTAPKVGKKEQGASWETDVGGWEEISGILEMDADSTGCCDQLWLTTPHRCSLQEWWMLVESIRCWPWEEVWPAQWQRLPTW